MKKILLCLICMLVLTTSCTERPPAEESLQPVKTTSPEVRHPVVSHSYPVRLEARKEARLSFRIPGPISRLLVEEGDYFRQGDLLATIDPRDYQLQLEAAEEQYNMLKSTTERIISLHEKGRVSEDEYEKAIATLKQVESKYRAHQNAMEDTRLVAPFDGQVINTFFSEKEVVDAGMPVISVADPDDYQIVAHLAAGTYLRHEEFHDFYLITTHYPDRRFPLELRTVTSQANTNGLYPAFFDISPEPDAVLLPGMNAELVIEFREHVEVLFTLPAPAVFKQGEQNMVWVIDPETQRVYGKAVELLRIESSGYALVKGDLQPEDIIVSAGLHALEEGQQVEPLPEASETNIGNMM